MRILIVTQYFWPENFRINDLCVALKERGHEVVIYTGLPNYPQGKFFKGYSLSGPYKEQFEGMDVLRVPMLPRGSKKGSLLALNYLSYFVSATFFSCFKLRGKFDKIFVYEPSPITVAIPAIFIRKIWKVPMVLWVTDLWPESLEATGTVKNKFVLNLVGKMVSWIYKNTDQILMTSKGFKKKILKYCDDQAKLKYWPQWAEKIFSGTEALDYTDESFPTGGFNVVFAGNIGSAQDFETIVDTAKSLKAHSDINIVILGDGLMYKWVKECVEKYQLQATLYMLGRKPLETMPYYFNKADALLLTLRDSDIFSITIPSKLQSYLASGKPIICGVNGEASSIIDEWQAGFTSRAGKPESLHEAIVKLYKCSAEERDRLGKNALKCYESEFYREKLVSQLESILEETKL